MSPPAKATRAAEWIGTRPAIALTKVDLPAPFGPSTTTSSPVLHREIDAAHDRQVGLIAGDQRLWCESAASRSRARLRDRPRSRAGSRATSAGVPSRSRLPVRHDDDAAAEPRHHVHVVLDQQDGLAAAR